MIWQIKIMPDMFLCICGVWTRAWLVMLGHQGMEWVSSQATCVVSWLWHDSQAAYWQVFGWATKVTRLLTGSSNQISTDLTKIDYWLSWSMGWQKTGTTANKMLCNIRNELHFQSFKEFWLSESFWRLFYKNNNNRQDREPGREGSPVRTIINLFEESKMVFSIREKHSQFLFHATAKCVGDFKR